MDGVIRMARVALDVTNYLVDGQLPADTVCEWLDGLEVTVGTSRNEFGHAMINFHGPSNDLATLIGRVEEDAELASETIAEIKN